VTQDSRAGSWKSAWSDARMLVAVAAGSPVPRLRAYTGWAPLETFTS
jgi:hypothetical protein